MAVRQAREEVRPGERPRSGAVRSFVGPGATLEVSATLEHDGSGYAVTKAAIQHDGKPLANAELRFRTMPFPAGLDGPMRARARKIGLFDLAGEPA